MAVFTAKPLSGAAMEVLWGLFVGGPTWDGDVASKRGRDELCELGLAQRHDGWQWLTDDGAIAAIDAGYGDRKEAWQRKQAMQRRGGAA